MNYIPGFSNYLETSVPRYADGGAVMDPSRQAAVMPMATEAVPSDAYAEGWAGPDLSGFSGFAPYDPSSGHGFGLGHTPGYVPPWGVSTAITAPISNKGNPTAYGGNNQFKMMPNHFVRIVDRNTNTVLFEGTGVEAAQKAVEMGQNLTDTMGRKANYQIEIGKTQDSYYPVASEKYNKSTLSKVANVVGTVAPLAMALIPGANIALLGSKVAGGIAAGALLGGASAGLKGDNILKGAALGGLTAAGGQALGPILGNATGASSGLARAIGTGIGATAGGLATGQNLQNSLLGGAISGGLSYVAPSIRESLGIGGGSGFSVGGGDIDPSIINVLATPSIPTAVNVGGGAKAPALPRPTTEAELAAAEAARNPIVSTGAPSVLPTVVPVGGGGLPTTTTEAELAAAEAARNPIVSTGAPSVLPTVVPVTGNLSPDVLAGMAEFEKNPIISEGSKIEQPTGGLTLAQNPVVNGVDQVTKEIVATGNKLQQPTTAVPITGDGFTLEPEVLSELDKLSEAEKEAETKKKLGLEDYLRLAGLASGLLGGAGGGGSGQAGTYTRGGLNPIFSAKLPTANIPGGVGAASNLDARPMGEEDWLTYGTRPERSFYEYVPQPTGMAEGGALPAKHGGSPDRTEFAVNGPGTGRSDDIPAVLSDGEYVIDAETVALLGDGSSKAGAKKLDDLRVKVRKHKGQKLAKGRFSANAKKPEAYLSGGRI